MPGGGEVEHSSSSSLDISGVRSGALFALPPPTPLDIHDSNAAEKWKEFEKAWRNYLVAMKLHQEPETIQIATLLTVIGAKARKVFSTFTFGEGNRDRIQPILESFAAYCQPLKNVPFKRYRFYSRMQEAGAPFVGERVFQNLRVCGQASPSFPFPTPFLPPFCSRPIFRVFRMRKINTCGVTHSPNFVRFVRERLLHRLRIQGLYFLGKAQFTFTVLMSGKFMVVSIMSVL